MRRQHALVLAALGIMVVVAAVAQQKQAAPGRLLLLEWAGKGLAETPPTAILIEMGFKDAQAKNWSGKADVSGAKVVHREGYRFRDKDNLTEPDGWEASSHKPIRTPPNQPPALTQEPFATVGVVLHLNEIKPNASLTLSVKEQEINEKVPLQEVLAGKKHSIQNGRAVVRLVTTATPVETGKTEDDFPAACYGPDGTLWVAYVSYTVREEDRRIEAPNLKEQPQDFKSFSKPGFSDQLFVKSYRDGKWSKPLAITSDKQDLMRCAIAAEKDGTVWVVYSANREGKFNLYARPISPKYNPEGKANASPQPGPEQQLTRKTEPQFSPVMTTNQAGNVRLTYQSWQANELRRASQAS